MLAARAVVIGVLATAATLGVQQLVSRPLHQLVRASAAAVSDHDVAPLVLPLDELVVIGAAAALAGCWLWLMLGVVSAALTVVTSRVAIGRAAGGGDVRVRCLRLGPAWVRALTAVALGVTALQAPAQAETGGERVAPTVVTGALSGLPLPDRAVAPAPRTAPPPRSRPSERTVRVAPGDSLWSIAAHLLPDDAGAGEVDRAWRLLAAANAAALGPDPDLIFPGTELQVPPLDRPLREERP